MAKQGQGGEKTEQATPQKVKKSRKDGQVARTPELGTWFGVAVASVMIPRTVAASMDRAQRMTLLVPEFMENPDPLKLEALIMHVIEACVVVILPLALAMLAIGVAAGASQGGVVWANKALMPNLKKLNPWTGVKRMMGPQALWEATKALVKTGALGLALWTTTDTVMELVSASGRLPLSSVIATVSETAVDMMQVVAFTGLAIAAIDYVIVKRRLSKDLRMSKYEVRQEYKQQEGDPLMKQQRRAMSRSFLASQSRVAVEEADVLLVNPTHVAVALKYDAAKGGVPTVTAKGRGAKAAQLREWATEFRTPMVADVPLARAVHGSCDVGQPIPNQLFDAVAQVLAFVYALKTQGAASGVHRPGFKAPDVEGLPRAGRRRR